MMAIERKQVRDGIIVSEELTVNMRPDAPISEVMEDFQTVFPGAEKLVEGYANKARRAIAEGATGTRLKYAEDTLMLERQTLKFLAKKDTAAAVMNALWMMTSLWRLDMKGVEPVVMTGAAATTQRKNAGIASGEERKEERKPEWDKWQHRAEEVSTANPRLSKSQVCAIVGKEFNVTGRAVSGRVKNVGKERRRSKT